MERRDGRGGAGAVVVVIAGLAARPARRHPGPRERHLTREIAGPPLLLRPFAPYYAPFSRTVEGEGA